jgi:hypothetical protein
LKKKTYRGSMVINNPGFQVTLACHYWVGKPVQWLWRRIEYLDAHGGSLLDLASPKTNPFRAAQQQMVDMLMKPPMDTSIHVLLHQYEHKPDLLLAAQGTMFEMLASCIAQLDFKLIWMLEDWPFPLIKGVANGLQARLDVCAEFFLVPLCDLEPFMARKLQQRWANSEQMARDENFWQSFSLWARNAVLGNMGCERLLALIKCSLLGGRWIPSMETALCVEDVEDEHPQHQQYPRPKDSRVSQI